MALSLAIPLAGIDIHQFNGIHRALCRADLLAHEQQMSPSARSDSSGISSLTATTGITTPSLSPISDHEAPTEDNNSNTYERRCVRRRSTSVSHPLAAADNCKVEIPYRPTIQPPVLQTCEKNSRKYRLMELKSSSTDEREISRVMYGNRNILNLGGNLRGTFWQMRKPTAPYDHAVFHDRKKMTKKIHKYECNCSRTVVRLKYCKHCNFGEPHLFEGPPCVKHKATNYRKHTCSK